MLEAYVFIGGKRSNQSLEVCHDMCVTSSLKGKITKGEEVKGQNLGQITGAFIYNNFENGLAILLLRDKYITYIFH